MLNFHPIELKLENNLQIGSLNSTTYYFCGQHRLKRQQRPKGQQLAALSKILNFHPIDLKFEVLICKISICISGQWIQLPINFKVKKVNTCLISKIDRLGPKTKYIAASQKVVDVLNRWQEKNCQQMGRHKHWWISLPLKHCADSLYLGRYSNPG